jgi:hypothetical protein
MDAASNDAMAMDQTPTQLTLCFLSRTGGVGAMLHFPCCETPRVKQ